MSAPQHNHAFMYTPLNPNIQNKDKSKIEKDWSDMSADTDHADIQNSTDTDNSSVLLELNAEQSSAIRYKCVINSSDYSFYFEPIDLFCPTIEIRKWKLKRKQKLKESNKAWIPKVKV